MPPKRHRKKKADPLIPKECKGGPGTKCAIKRQAKLVKQLPSKAAKPEFPAGRVQQRIGLVPVRKTVQGRVMGPPRKAKTAPKKKTCAKKKATGKKKKGCTCH